MDSTTSPKKKWILTPEAFNGLLSWLDPDRERAGEKYEEIRSRLISGFRRHGCTEAEELADETTTRVAKKLPEIRASYLGDPARYFFGVAHNVRLEYQRKSYVAVPLSPGDMPACEPFDSLTTCDEEPEYECLERCIEQLTPRSRELILQYYQGEGQTKIRLRKDLASRLGVRVEALRIKAQRIRATLKDCILACLGQAAVKDNQA